MFTIRIHSVDIDHPLFLSLPSNSNPNPNPKFVERRGIIHLFRTLDHHHTDSIHRSNLLFIVAVPNYFSSDDLLRFFGSHVDDVSEFIIIRNDGMEDRYSVLIQTMNEVSADALYRKFNGKRFSPPEVEICHILFVLSMEFTELAEIASTPLPGYTELPTCPICLERLDQDTSGIQSTLCDHSFQCSCISKWTYLSCEVCRLCQQQDDITNCSVCDTSENLWVCIICGFVGCGRYKEGHTFRHWKDTQHCYSLNLETQRVWDYEGDSYVHRLNHSKAEGKSMVSDSQCMSRDGDCGTCNHDEDSEMTGALFGSIVDAITDEYNHLLATQLENQRQYYESLVVEAKSKKDNTLAEAVEKAISTKMQDLQCRIDECEEAKKAVLNMNHTLIKEQEEYKKKKEIEERILNIIMNTQGKRLMGSSSTQKRGYVTWTPQMDAILASTLIDQMNEGNKGDGDFKPQAYQAVVDKLRIELRLLITTDHAKNRIKVWKKHHAIITDIRTYTKFKWNDEKKMVEIDIHDIPLWHEYCKENPNASAYLNKRIENWDDICTLVSVDRAIGDGAEQHEESSAAMEAENEGANISETTSGESSSKKLKRDRLADAVSSFAESFKEYVQSRNPPKPDSKEVYDVVSNVVGLSRQQVLKAAKQFLNNTAEFDMLKGLPENEKLDWVLLCLE